MYPTEVSLCTAGPPCKVYVGHLDECPECGARVRRTELHLISDLTAEEILEDLETTRPYKRRHKDALLEALRSLDGWSTMTDLEIEYRSRVDEPRSRRTLRNHLHELASDELVDISGTNRGREYRAREVSTT